MIDLGNVFGMTAFGIEEDLLTYKGSLMHIKSIVQQMDASVLCVPCIQLNVDGYDINIFGGTNVVYIWCRGTVPDLLVRIYNRFCIDHTCTVIITSTRCHQTLLQADNLEVKRQLTGVFSGSGKWKMEIYFYVNNSISAETDYISDDKLDNKIRTVFYKGAIFKQMKKEEKQIARPRMH